MDFVFAFFAGLFITMAAVPAFARVAGPLHLLDQPSPRKVHTTPVPRTGGLALGLSTLLATATWVSNDPQITAYLAAGMWIMLFGALDDARNLNYKWKLLAQLPPVFLAIYSGIVLHHLPFFGLDPAPAWVSIPVTTLFLLGVTNAVNLVDGLDGLAGGCMLLTLAAIAFLAFAVDGTSLTMLSLILMGAILGFLNYNSHPASIFLGDAGSQFLGFSIGAFAIMLTEVHHTALNPTIPFLLLGLPLLDTTWVFFLRISQGKSPFRADKQHLHHQLLSAGFGHGHAVSAVYLFQAALVATALLVPYGSDLTVVGLLILESSAFVVLTLAMRWRRNSFDTYAQNGHRQYFIRRWRDALAPHRGILDRSTELVLALILVSVAFFGRPFPDDVAAVSLGLVGLLGFGSIFMTASTTLFTRIGFYVAGALTVYGLEPLSQFQGPTAWLPTACLAALALLLVSGIALTEREHFQVSPQDLLVGFIALAAAALRDEILPDVDLGFMIIAAMILFYACEYLISVIGRKLFLLRAATLATLLTVGIRGLI